MFKEGDHVVIIVGNSKINGVVYRNSTPSYGVYIGRSGYWGMHVSFSISKFAINRGSITLLIQDNLPPFVNVNTFVQSPEELWNNIDRDTQAVMVHANWQRARDATIAFLLVCRELGAIHRNVVPIIAKLVLTSWMEDAWND